MGIVAEQLEGLTVTAVSPDGRITARVSKRSSLSLKFQDGSYQQYSTESLEHQLSRTATTLWVEWQRGYAETMKRLDLRPLTKELAVDEATRRFFIERVDITGHGMSGGKVVQAKTRGLKEWEFRIKPGSLAALPEQEFIGEALSAGAKARNAYMAKLETLKRRLFD